ncbi:MAG: ATPase [bacterium]|nr:ATPase [bacterium]MDY4100296.1 ATPase [Lachnospiraceae bacterium]
MNSKIEQTIEELEQYIDTCKPQAFSSNKIIVNKDQIEELLTELRLRTPEEIKRYQKMISNKEAILADAQAKADTIIAQAEVTHSELVSEHQIMQQAYAQANEVVMIATKQAQEILDNATNDANNIRMSAITYTDELLKNLEAILSGAIEGSKARYENLITGLNNSLQVVLANRAELMPQADPELAEDEPVRAEPEASQVQPAAAMPQES